MSPQDQLAPPGERVDIGGFRLHALLRGQGTPTVILEPGLGGFAQQYGQVQSGVAAFTQVLAYDRAGQGWSDISQSPRTPASLAGELRALLDRLDLRPPYVLAGHSFGGLLVRIYAGLYPQEVAGVVLIDSSHEDLYELFPDMDKMVGRAAMGLRLLKLVSRLGLGKQLTRLSLGSAAKSIPPDQLDTFLAVASQPKHQEGTLAEYAQHRFYFGPGSEVPRTLGDIPLLVLTAGQSVSGGARIGSLTGEQMNAEQQRMQKELVGLSSRGEQVVLPRATHLSILAAPEHVAQVVEAIRRMVEALRQGVSS